jgi:hypothetical protein
MLGKVYESLIFEEERGEAGIFYTPRVEVDFMCRQSLLEYLIGHTDLPYDMLISFIYNTEEDRAELLSEEEAQQIGNALFRVQIVDPACGSGAFLVGMLHVLFEFYTMILKRLNKSLNFFEIKKEYKAALVRSVTAQWGSEYTKNLKSDLYIYFYYHGLSLLKSNGVFCFISSNSWLDVGFAFFNKNMSEGMLYIDILFNKYKKSNKRDIVGEMYATEEL